MADWQCKQCKQNNPNEEDFCDKCFAPRRASGAPRETCRTCLHRHSTGKCCHVYVVDRKRQRRKAEKWSKAGTPAGDSREDGADGESSSASTDSTLEESVDGDSSERENNDTDEEQEEEEEEQEEEEEGEGDSSDEDSATSSSEDVGDEVSPKKRKGLLGLGDRLAAKASAIAESAGQALKAEGRTVEHEAVGTVTIRTESPVGKELEFENRLALASTPPPPHALRLFLEYVDPRTVARCAHASTEWHRECYAKDEEGRPMHPAYLGVHFMELDSWVDACEDKVPPDHDASPKSEDGKSRASDEQNAEDGAAVTTIRISWQAAGVAVRDTAPFTAIRPVNNSIFCCSSNGSIREWSLAHEVKNTRFVGQMWEHNGYVTDVAFTAPSLGYCKAHGAPAHSCYMYSVSDDRSLKVWDLSTKECLHTVRPKVSNCGTLQSVAKSDFHLYVGSSNGRIIVYALGRVCQRPEKHRCHLQDEPHWFCEQERFEHGDEPVQHMVCGGLGGTYEHLFTGARDGSIQVWKVPKASFGHKKVCMFRHHRRAITALSVTKAHLFSASDDGHLRIWNLGTLTLQRVVKQERRIKCIWVHHAPPEAPDAGKGSLFVGLATGLVLAYPITSAV